MGSTPPLFGTPPSTTTTTDLDAFGAAAELQFGDSAARYRMSIGSGSNSRAHIPRHRALHHSRPAAGPAGRFFYRACPHTSAPPSRSFRILLATVGSTPPTTVSIVLCSSVKLSRPPSGSQRPVEHAARLLRDEPVRIYVPLLMRSWVIQRCCRSTAAPAAPRPHRKCSNGSLWTYASGGGFAIA